MGSRREEERNEKIIRGLMKLPPNRRCINCNSLGPQYVCTNFWTFVCMTCSGIHREFTHRVKSVSMSKFTSQEVEALQNGGNQRAREIYLKDWDQQQQRLPDNSNVDKVREFIKSVYVDKRYAGGKSADKPPRDLQSVRSLEGETRRASSYHSYSQSPPYDYQYEDWRYGKPAATLTRKPGSDRGLYVGKMSSYISSPNHLSERMFEDRFANEGSVSRFSDYSASSGGDPVRSGTASPNYQKDIGFNSPPIQPSRGNLSDVQKQTINLFAEASFQRERTASLGSVASFDSNSMSLKSFNSGSLVDVVSEPEQAVRAHQDDMSIFPQTSPSGPDILETSKVPVVPGSDSAATSQIDLFQLPGAPSTPSVDALHVPPLNQAPSMNAYELPQKSLSSSLDLFSEISQQQSISDKKPMQLSVTKNEGWATFDTSQTAASLPGKGNYTPLAGLALPAGVVSSTNIDQVSSSNVSMQWPPFQSSGAHASLSVSEPWHGGLHDVHVPGNTAAQTWNAFDNSITSLSLESIRQSNEVQVAAYKPSSTADQYFGSTALEESSKGEIQGAASHGGLSGVGGPSDYSMAPPYTPLVHPLMEETQSQATIHRSTNPFDLPYESDLEPGNMFLDMSSLQAALPNSHLASTYLDSVTQPWFSQDPVTTFVPATPQAGLGYMAGQAPSPQLGGIQAQEPVPSSVGGNPFA